MNIKYIKSNNFLQNFSDIDLYIIIKTYYLIEQNSCDDSLLQKSLNIINQKLNINYSENTQLLINKFVIINYIIIQNRISDFMIQYIKDLDLIEFKNYVNNTIKLLL
jgi:hypothetical protein